MKWPPGNFRLTLVAAAIFLGLPGCGPVGVPVKPAETRGESLDEIDSKSFAAGPSPMPPAPVDIELREGKAPHGPPPPGLSLDGDWIMAENGAEPQRLRDAWTDGIPAAVPGSVHGALQAAGKIPDPKFGLNDAIARKKSFQTWWFRRTFTRPAADGQLVVFGERLAGRGGDRGDARPAAGPGGGAGGEGQEKAIRFHKAGPGRGVHGSASTKRTSFTCGPIFSRASRASRTGLPLNRRFRIVTPSTVYPAS